LRAWRSGLDDRSSWCLDSAGPVESSTGPGPDRSDELSPQHRGRSQDRPHGGIPRGR
jgi:hypothetical protein